MGAVGALSSEPLELVDASQRPRGGDSDGEAGPSGKGDAGERLARRRRSLQAHPIWVERSGSHGRAGHSGRGGDGATQLLGGTLGLLGRVGDAVTLGPLRTAGAAARATLLPVAVLGLKLGALRVVRASCAPAYAALEVAALVVPLLPSSGRLGPLGPALRAGGGVAGGVRGAMLCSVALDALRHVRRTGARSASPADHAVAERERERMDALHKMAGMVPRYKSVVQRLKRELVAAGAVLPSDRFDGSDAELMRFLVACDVTNRVGKPGQADAVVTQAARRVVEAAEWREGFDFLGRADRRWWKKYVLFFKRDKYRRPVLFVNFDRAAADLKAGDTPDLVQAIVSQIEHGVNTKLGNGPGAPEQIVVVVKCTESSLLRAKRMVAVLRPTVATLQKAYPERLGQLYLVGMPGVVGAVVSLMRSLLPARTQSKVRVVNQFDPELPPLPGLAPLARGGGAGPSLSLGRRAPARGASATEGPPPMRFRSLVHIPVPQSTPHSPAKAAPPPAGARPRRSSLSAESLGALARPPGDPAGAPAPGPGPPSSSEGAPPEALSATDEYSDPPDAASPPETGDWDGSPGEPPGPERRKVRARTRRDGRVERVVYHLDGYASPSEDPDAPVLFEGPGWGPGPAGAGAGAGAGGGAEPLTSHEIVTGAGGPDWRREWRKWRRRLGPAPGSGSEGEEELAAWKAQYLDLSRAALPLLALGAFLYQLAAAASLSA